ncbi:Dps family protein [Ekhidna sp.]|uniref:Dps family protein n=1 Tax=Ekhidna sp. TaxID=2608089 RepID=UPI003C7A2EE2
MKRLEAIGLNPEKSKKLSEALGKLLANYSIFYQNVRGFHWNIEGRKFFELHMKFEELYNDIILKIDDVAERMRTLDAIPNHQYSKYLELATIKESDILDVDGQVECVLSGLQTLIKQQRILMELAQEANDEGTAAMLSDNIREQEKLTWMFSSFLND